MGTFEGNDFKKQLSLKEANMTLSKESVEALSDLIENRLSIMTIGDQDDLREKVKLQRALSELQRNGLAHDGVMNQFASIPRRGRRRKVGEMGERT
jgi:hypothetical protein